MKAPKTWVDRATFGAFGILVVALVALLAIRPSIDNSFHAEYLENLGGLESLSGELEREHRNVQAGLTQHYDFLEATLQEMDKAAQLIVLYPSFVNEAYVAQTNGALQSYQSTLQRLRSLVEKTKRYTGLLRNSNQSLRTLARDTANAVNDQGHVPASVVELFAAIAELDASAESAHRLAKLDLSSLPKTPALPQLSLHISMIEKLTPLQAQVNAKLHEALRDTTEPTKLMVAYQAQYFAAVNRTQTVLWASYAVAGLLLVLAVVQVLRARNASAKAEQLAVELKAQLQKIQTTVAACKEALESVANGRFDRRVELQVDGNLGELCAVVNASADRVECTITEIERVMGEIVEGRFEVQVHDHIQGGIRDAVDQATTSLQHAFTAIRVAMERMAGGEFSARVDVDAKGDLKILKDAVNGSMKSLQTAMSDINTVVLAQSSGVLSCRIERPFPGELGVLADAVNASADSLCQTIDQVRQVSQTVDSAAEQVDDSSRGVTEAAQHQLDALRSARDATHEISEGIHRSAEDISAAGGLAIEAKLKANNGEAVVGKAQAAMTSIIDSSRKIEDIVGIIEAIAFQTNLLALNAAVEAARAQEHGRGFAVVASEVRNLAQQSAAASSNIKQLIDESVAVVRRGAHDVQETGVALEDISNVVVQLNEIFQRVADSNLEQKTGTDRVSQYMERLAELSERNCQLADGNNASSKELDENAKHMLKVLNQFHTARAESKAAA